MISKLAKGIAHFFVVQNITEESKEIIYAYGMELLISDVLNTLKEIDINDLEIVYLYDNDENTNEIFECDWAGLDNVTINSSVISNISYDEDLECSKITLSFNQVENSILPENADLDVHFRVHTISWDNYDITNDYSLNGRDYSENDRILVYYNGVLVSGNVE